MLIQKPWKVVWQRSLAGATLGEELYFSLPMFAIMPTFRLKLDTWTSGTMTVQIRFGFDDADASAGVNTLGIDLGPLAAVNASAWGSIHYGAAGIGAPNVQGNPFSIVPPRVAILGSAPVSTLSFEVSYTCLAIG